MVKKVIRTGTTADPTGDSLKNAFVKVNDNFTELYKIFLNQCGIFHVHCTLLTKNIRKQADLKIAIQ